MDFVTNEAGNVVVTVKIGEATYNDVVGAISKDNERNMTIDLSAVFVISGAWVFKFTVAVALTTGTNEDWISFVPVWQTR